MDADDTQRSTVLVADHILGPYEIVRTGLEPLGMSAGDFDLVVDPDDDKAYYYFERVHTDLICADLDDDYTDVTGDYTTHFPHRSPPFVREAPAHFDRDGIALPRHVGNDRVLPESVGDRQCARRTTGHGPCSATRTRPTPRARRSTRRSLRCSAIRPSAICTSPWPTGGCPICRSRRASTSPTGEASAVATQIMARVFDAEGVHHDDETDLPAASEAARQRCGPLLDLSAVDTSVSTYVWLPFRFDGDVPTLDWRDEWSIDEFD